MEILQELLNMGVSSVTDMLGSTILGLLIKGVFLVTYPLYAYALYKLAVQKKILLPWLSFVPVVNQYVLGSLVGKMQILGKQVPYFAYVMPVLALAARLPIPMLGAVLSMASTLLYWLAIHRLYEIYFPERADLYLIVGIVSKCLTPYFVFTMRDRSAVCSKLLIDDDGDGRYDRELIDPIPAMQQGVRQEIANVPQEQRVCDCGQPLRAGTVFCGKCGCKVKEEV